NWSFAFTFSMRDCKEHATHAISRSGGFLTADGRWEELPLLVLLVAPAWTGRRGGCRRRCRFLFRCSLGKFCIDPSGVGWADAVIVFVRFRQIALTQQ